MAATSSREEALSSLRAAGLSDSLYTPDQESYHDRISSYWPLSAQLRPWEIIQPRNTDEVSKAVKAIVGVPGVKFAVWSGGHMAWPGANNIKNGITIDLGLLSGVSYDAETEVASLYPGAIWADAYRELEQYGRMFAGGRDGKVGIGGLILGGGKTFYACRVGLACDQVINYELVLANGTIINANSFTDPDLFLPLKGSGNNFGIVTRFDMVTFPAEDVWDCNLVCSKRSTRGIGEALLQFTKGLEEKPNDHILAMWIHLPGAKEHVVIPELMILDGVEKADSNFYLSMVLQPLPTSFGKHSLARGGNMLGLENINQDCILLVWAVELDSSELNERVVAAALKRAIEEIETFAEAENGGEGVGSRYFNHCYGAQDPLGYYGCDKVEFMRGVAERVDPEGVFQESVSGRFKISKARGHWILRGGRDEKGVRVSSTVQNNDINGDYT
ncbi:hypothetical protein BJY04DRAFT_222456 [Aspergillus karnatakaensis]|uniref:FAD-binding oxidoreductase n=1 Tax=Aspergillus karnatakaensis TaxID=1810916 RepID=UPI003CCD923A